jgi:membrane fusion protein, copper/silver efflux system
MKRLWFVTLLILALLAVVLAAAVLIIHHRSDGDAGKPLYTCPMHPQIVRDAPGDCPICGMTLVPIQREEPAAGQPGGHGPKTMYRSTMNPDEISDKPGKDSMGMDMVAFEQEEEKVETPEGLAAVTVSREKRDLIGLSFSPVTRMHLLKETRTSARITADETRLFRITVKMDGWAEKLFVNQTGQAVRKGDPLFEIYSPDLVSAQQEYISSVHASEKQGASVDSAGVEGFESSATAKLRLLDIDDSQIRRLRDSGTIERTMTIRSPVSGVVTEKMLLQGQRVMMNETLMTMADLSRVWGEAVLYETDLPWVKVGMPAQLSLSYWPGKSFSGRIGFIRPFLDTETRTATARIEIPNPDLDLKPGMSADVTLTFDLGERLAVPEAAVMRTGTRDYVFLEGDGDALVPREVRLGALSEQGVYEVISGLKEGDRAVTSANFLVDSESSLKAAFQSAAREEMHQP